MSTPNSTEPSATHIIVVGVGAADGGIEALESFLHAFPGHDNVTFVLAFHTTGADDLRTLLATLNHVISIASLVNSIAFACMAAVISMPLSLHVVNNMVAH
jgi:chemotaxis response regulator CheB